MEKHGMAICGYRSDYMINDYTYTDRELIDAMVEFRNENGRWPKLRDMRGPEWPGRTTYATRFATEEGKQDGFGVALTLAQSVYEMEQRIAEAEQMRKESKLLYRVVKFVKKIFGVA
jgi:hypothetical protein